MGGAVARSPLLMAWNNDPRRPFVLLALLAPILVFPRLADVTAPLL